MGLDVYLEKCSNKEEADRLEAEYERRSNAVWDALGDYDSITTEQKGEARSKTDAIKEELGLVDWGRHPAKEKVEIDSTKYPDHYFKIGYFRSSYNGGGINNVMRRRGLPDLYGVFLPNDRYDFAPDWEACLDRANALLEACRAYNNKRIGRYDCMEVSANLFGNVRDLPKNESDALAIFGGQVDYTGSRAYSNADGWFYLDGMKCVAFIPGMNIWNKPCVYVVYEKEDADEQDWYEQALEIVVETIEYVLAQPNTEDFYLVWSS